MKTFSTLVFLLFFYFCLAQPHVTLTEVASGLNGAISDITHSSDNRMYVTQQMGYIHIVQPNGTVLPRPFLDIHAKVTPTNVDSVGEQGLLGLAFSPGYATDGNFYVHYTDKTGAGNVVIARYHVSTDPDSADVASEEILLRIYKPFRNHNGGCLKFGPDGYLYIGPGDGGSGGDPLNRAQNLDSLQGKILRIDVSGMGAYSIPSSNPFYNSPPARGEIWAYGLRNPWRFSFDKHTNDLWIADVGQEEWEEVNFQPAASTGGENYGWRCYEGNHDFNLSGCGPASGYKAAIAEYSHSIDSGCSVTGGYVYRGTEFPSMYGYYFCADYCSGKIYAVKADSTFTRTLAGDFNGKGITTFGQNNAGDLFVADNQAGKIYKLVATSTGIEEMRAGDAQFSVFPVPNSGSFTCLINVIESQNAEIYLRNVSGKIVYATQKYLVAGNNRIEFTMDGIAAGYYLLQLESGYSRLYKPVLIVKN